MAKITNIERLWPTVTENVGSKRGATAESSNHDGDVSTSWLENTNSFWATKCFHNLIYFWPKYTLNYPKGPQTLKLVRLMKIIPAGTTDDGFYWRGRKRS